MAFERRIFSVWDQDEDDADEIEVTADATLHAAVSLAATRYLERRSWSDGFPDVVFVREPSGALRVVEVEVDWDPVFYASPVPVFDHPAAPDPTLWWLMWCQSARDRHSDPDSFPAETDDAGAPLLTSIIGYWEVGEGGHAATPDGSPSYVNIVALVRARNRDQAWGFVKDTWDPGVGDCRFVEPFTAQGAPASRYPPPRWSLRTGRWPWSVP